MTAPLEMRRVRQRSNGARAARDHVRDGGLRLANVAALSTTMGHGFGIHGEGSTVSNPALLTSMSTRTPRSFTSCTTTGSGAQCEIFRYDSNRRAGRREFIAQRVQSVSRRATKTGHRLMQISSRTRHRFRPMPVINTVGVSFSSGGWSCAKCCSFQFVACCKQLAKNSGSGNISRLDVADIVRRPQ